MAFTSLGIYESFGFRQRGSRFVVVHEEGSPPTDGWWSFVHHVSCAKSSELALLVISYGGYPSRDQGQGLGRALHLMGASKVVCAFMLEDPRFPPLVSVRLSHHTCLKTFGLNDFHGARAYLGEQGNGTCCLEADALTLHRALDLRRW